MKKILVSLSIIGVVAAIAIGATVAYYNDVETSTGNTMTAGTLDLKIDLQCLDTLCGWTLRDLPDEPAFFKECDIKPGDSGEVTISWHVDNNAWARLKLANIFDWEYGCNDSEIEAGDTTCGAGADQGELSKYLTFTFWMDEGSVAGWQCPGNEPCPADPQEGNNVLDGIETILTEVTGSQLVNGVSLPIELVPSTVYYLGMKWTIPPETGNIIQTDSLSAKILMEVVQSRNNPWLINGGFENGNFTGWSVNFPSLAKVVTTYTSDQGTVYGPKEGSKFAVLSAGGGAGVYTVVSQTVNLTAGQKLAGWAAFDAKDYVPFDDDSAVVIVSGGPLATPWSAKISDPDVGNYGETDWEYWSWTAPADGLYTLELKVRNVGDNVLPSTALFDANVVLP